MAEAVPTPPRGTRPRNRRQLIMAAAAELFARDGYAHVSMGDVADAVAVRPSALYQHFRGKDDLLYEVVNHELAAIGSAVESVGTADRRAAIRAIVAASLDHRGTGVLWQRESRHLAPAARDRLREQLVTTGRRYAELVGPRRPELAAPRRELITWASLAALMSISFQRIRLPRAEYEELLAAIAEDVLDARIEPSGEEAPAASTPSTGPLTSVEPLTRRDELLSAAARLFAERGYRTVGVDDVGAAVGITGPSVYHHFDGKLDLLVTIMLRGAEQLRHQMSRLLPLSTDDAAALRGLAHSYTAYSFANSDVMDLLIAETAHLPDRERTAIRDVQRSYVAEWVRLLREIHGGLSDGHARVRVQAALNVINDTARTPSLRTQAGIVPAVCAIVRSVLRLTP
ncbi:TetR/AcrR family transcriptional regulator [Actinomadura vinacea]|uniref:TetR/AcrR family transcriptional regulator n=2 Tax=Actinomadura vinacea TaxID=115336 RepID=A0ABN3J6Q7_9ACTN